MYKFLIFVNINKGYIMYPKIIDSKGVIIMRMANKALYMMMGIGATILYQQIKNGNMKKIMKDMENLKCKTMEDLEDMVD